MAMFDTVLVANRGEIAVRIIRTLHRLGIRSVAVYSDADAGATHVGHGRPRRPARTGEPARDSYLDVDPGSSTRPGADRRPGRPSRLRVPGRERGVRPGLCRPRGDLHRPVAGGAIEVMGDKIAAKRAPSGGPVWPSSPDGPSRDDRRRAGGGGGRGRLPGPRQAVRGWWRQGHAESRGPRRPARGPAPGPSGGAASFGDDTLFVERFVRRPRHIEVQVLADGAGTTLHLGERECSLQRRHQKIIEEAPSVLLDAGTRERIGASACEPRPGPSATPGPAPSSSSSGAEPARRVLLHGDEHPAPGRAPRHRGGHRARPGRVAGPGGGRRPLGLTQDDIRLTGHAIEARLYAEDPAQGFLPAPEDGWCALREPPGAGHRTRQPVVRVGLDVGTTYDPMLAKVIAWGPDRRRGHLARLDRALASTAVLGFATNRGLPGGASALGHPAVAGR